MKHDIRHPARTRRALIAGLVRPRRGGTEPSLGELALAIAAVLAIAAIGLSVAITFGD